MAQNNKADLEMDNAEQALDEKKFREALASLRRAEEYTGKWQPAISYLRILCLDEIFKSYTESSLDMDNLRTEIQKYTDWANANPGAAVADKVRKVIFIEQSLPARATVPEATRKKLALEKEAAVEWAKLQYSSNLVLLEYFEKKYKETPYARNATQRIAAVRVEAKRAKDVQEVNKQKEKAAALAQSLNTEMVFVKGGTFWMGTDKKDLRGRKKTDYNDNCHPAHKVTLSDFSIGKYEVTQAQWTKLMGKNPSEVKGDNLPVTNVSWNDVQGFIRKLNAGTGKTYRLPTEAEWEYAARGGAKGKEYKYSGGNNIDKVAWTNADEKGGKTIHPVGLKAPNGLGLYDMTGNVSELCLDNIGAYTLDGEYYGYSSDPQTNPKGSSTPSEYRIIRGGNYNSNKYSYYTSGLAVYQRGKVSRSEKTSDQGKSDIGFRLVCEAE
jgi:formylglycine-generating enzyme required for sulfatase activity